MVILEDESINIVVGPYIGKLEQEIFTFRPYTAWLYRSLRSHCDNFYVSTHAQHQFLYDWDDINFVPVDDSFSVDADHFGVMNNKVNNKDYLSLIKQLKNSIDGETVHCGIRYTKYDNFIVPVSKKIFHAVELSSDEPNEILLISRYGDMNILKRLSKALPSIREINGDYSSIQILRKILAAKLVICPCGVWTCFCNLHGIPVFSWASEGLGMYKSNGVYGFNNPKSYIIHHDSNDVEKLLSGIEYMRERYETI